MTTRTRSSRSGALLFLALVAWALAATTLPRPAAAQAGDQPESGGPPGSRSPRTAEILSKVGMLAPMAAGLAIELTRSGGGSEALPVALTMSGVVLGPAIGDFYGGDVGHAFGQIALRAALIGGGIGAALAICSGDNCTTQGWDFTPNGAAVAAALVAAGGCITAIILAGHDIDGVGDRVWVRNHKLLDRVSVTPTLDPAARGAGLRVRVRF